MYIKLVTILLEGVWVCKKSKARRRTGVGSGRVDPGKAVFFFSSLVYESNVQVKRFLHVFKRVLFVFFACLWTRSTCIVGNLRERMIIRTIFKNIIF